MRLKPNLRHTNTKLLKTACIIFAAALFASCTISAVYASPPARAEAAPNADGFMRGGAPASKGRGMIFVDTPVYPPSFNDGAATSGNMGKIDTSNLNQGYVLAKYTGDPSKAAMLYITKGDQKFAFVMDSKGAPGAYTLTWGDGAYKIQVLQQTSGNKYAVGVSASVNLKLGNNNTPFLTPSQMVRYSASNNAVKEARKLCGGSATDLDKAAAVVQYMIDNVTYDYNKAASTAGASINDFIPDVDKTLASNKGICFDYSVLVACMLRSQGVPTQVVIGYANSGGSMVYHAWNKVYIANKGWIAVGLASKENAWNRTDTTFLAGGKNNLKAMSKIVANDKNYTEEYIF